MALTQLGTRNVSTANPVITIGSAVAIDSVVIVAMTRAGTNTTDCTLTDSKGNTYTTVMSHISGSGSYFTSFWISKITAALVVGDTITISDTGTVIRTCVAVSCDSVGALTVNDTALGFDITPAIRPDSGEFLTTTIADAMLFTIFGTGGASAPANLTGISSGWTQVGNTGNFSNQRTEIYARQVAATGTYNFQASTTSNIGWTLLEAAFPIPPVQVITFATAGLLNLASADPSFKRTFVAPAGSLSLASTTPVVSVIQSGLVPATAARLNLASTTPAPTLKVTAPVGSLSLTSGVANASGGQTVVAVPASLSLTASPPTPRMSKTISASPAGILNLAVVSPGLVMGSKVIAPVGILTLTATAPQPGLKKIAPVGILNLAAANPLVSVLVRIVTPAAVLNFTAASPVFSAGSRIITLAGSLTLSVAIPLVKAAYPVTAGVLNLTASAAKASSLAKYTVPAGILTLTAVPPVNFLVASVVSALAGRLTLTASSVVFKSVLSTTAGILNLVSTTPTFKRITVTPPGILNLARTVPAPGVGPIAAAGVLSLAVSVPSAGLAAKPPAGILTLTGVAPSSSTVTVTRAPVGLVTLRGGSASVLRITSVTTASLLNLLAVAPLVLRASIVRAPYGLLTLARTTPFPAIATKQQSGVLNFAVTTVHIIRPVLGHDHYILSVGISPGYITSVDGLKIVVP